MPFYVWWAIPLVATIAAIVVVSWRSRDRDVDPHSSVAQRRAFERAMRKGVPGAPAAGGSGAATDAASGPARDADGRDIGAQSASDDAGSGPAR